MKRLLIVVVLVILAAIAGMVVRSHSRTGGRSFDIPGVTTTQSAGEVRDEIHKTYELSPGAQIEVSGINGAVSVETSDAKTAELYIVRTAKSPESLNRRKITIENSSTSLTIRSERGDVGFLGCLFGSNPTERVTLKLPRQISLLTKGVNGSVVVSEVDGSVQVMGVNGRVEVAQANGSADFKGINGNISVALKQLDKGGVHISGVNGNIELRLALGVNADLEARGMNGSVRSETTDVVVDKSERGNKYYAHIGNGGSPISVSGVNGNVRLTRAQTGSTETTSEKDKS
jgi:hypothetical protein